MFKRTLLVMLLIVLSLAACGGDGNGQATSGEQTEGAAGAAGDAASGEQLFAQNTIGDNNLPGCAGCHSTQAGTNLVGPTMAGLAARAAETVDSGDYQGSADSAEGYVRESIVDPNAHVAEGYAAGIMPQNYEEGLSEQQINDLVAYLMSLE